MYRLAVPYRIEILPSVAQENIAGATLGLVRGSLRCRDGVLVQWTGCFLSEKSRCIGIAGVQCSAGSLLATHAGEDARAPRSRRGIRKIFQADGYLQNNMDAPKATLV